MENERQSKNDFVLQLIPRSETKLYELSIEIYNNTGDKPENIYINDRNCLVVTKHISSTESIYDNFMKILNDIKSKFTMENIERILNIAYKKNTFCEKCEEFIEDLIEHNPEIPECIFNKEKIIEEINLQLFLLKNLLITKDDESIYINDDDVKSYIVECCDIIDDFNKNFTIKDFFTASIQLVAIIRTITIPINKSKEVASLIDFTLSDIKGAINLNYDNEFLNDIIADKHI